MAILKKGRKVEALKRSEIEGKQWILEKDENLMTERTSDEKEVKKERESEERKGK